ncbi:hypothetical protein QVA66_09395 [Staphylococcus chromogenes]|nr:hypothetical protein [Staphylococcus chromogenes]
MKLDKLWREDFKLLFKKTQSVGAGDLAFSRTLRSMFSLGKRREQGFLVPLLVIATIPLWGMRVISFGVGGSIEAIALLMLALCLPIAAIAPRLAAVACAGLLGGVGYAGFDLGSVVFSVVITIAVLASRGLFRYAVFLAGCMLISGFYSVDQRKFDYDVPSLILSSLLVVGAFAAGFLIHLYQTR